MNIFPHNVLSFRDCLVLDRPDRLCHLTPTVYTPLSIDAAQLTNALATLYTVPASTVSKLTSIVLNNDTTTAVTATIHIVPSGGAADATNTIINAMAIPVDGSPLIFEFDEFFMETGTLIRGVASVTTQVTYHISVVELA